MNKLEIKVLDSSWLPSIAEICLGNVDYYYHMNEAPESSFVAHTFESLPPGTIPSQKCNLGIFMGGELVAYVEMVKSYPDDCCAMIGLLMVKKHYQGKGLGSQIVSLTLENLRREGFSEVYLSCSSTDAHARRFWINRGFVETGDVDEYDDISLVAMERHLTI
ncbi:GNAT family N-acetyltransferase [Pseudomonas sp. CGJS7]|uniref:GNAT family N-acetyltransferase n=1 Tax=Pseudomonas sp. CGJS7 TaxID=3109348 RepID=UPI00300B3949